MADASLASRPCVLLMGPSEVCKSREFAVLTQIYGRAAHKVCESRCCSMKICFICHVLTQVSCPCRVPGQKGMRRAPRDVRSDTGC